MRKVLLLLFILQFLITPSLCAEIEPPIVPQEGELYMPPEAESFSEGLWYIIKSAINDINPRLKEASGTCLSLIAIVVLVSLLKDISKDAQKTVVIAAVAGIGALLLGASNSLIHLAANTIVELSDYGKLLLPVLATALASQGGTSSSAALYTGSALFCTVLTSLLTNIVVPLVYIYICISIAWSAIGEDALKSIRDFVKWLATWSMKIVLYIFSGYMGITKIISGSVDASALRAAKLTISGMVPVVGKIISDSSEAILISAGIVKNSAGIYGLLAILSVLVGPFIRIGTQYLLFKITASICDIFGIKQISCLISDFSKALGITLGMIGILAMMLMISTVCFMKGVL